MTQRIVASRFVGTLTEFKRLAYAKIEYALVICLFLAMTACLPASAQRHGGELLGNGVFEGGSGGDGRGGGIPEWAPFESGYAVDRQNHHGGDQSIRCDSLNPSSKRGAQITVDLNQKRATPVSVAGWSKADQVEGVTRSDYALYIDAHYMDGTPLWGLASPFSGGTHDWQRRQLLVTPTKPLKSITITALFRNHTGTAWFDDFSAHEVAGSGNFDGQPLAAPPFGAAAAPLVRVGASDGLALDLDRSGHIAGVNLGGRKVNSAAGGFYLRDVAADGPLVPVRGTTTPRKAGGYNIGAAVGALRVSFNTRIQTEGDAIAIDGEMTDLTKTDRAVSVYLALPVDALGWQWGQDIRHIQTIQSGEELTNQTRISAGATGGLSLYPYACVANAQGGIGIASQMDWPSVYRIFYNSTTRQLVIGWDFALTAKTAAWPSHNARFRCRLFRLPAGPPDWCFRAATQRFYRLNARSFARRAKQDGIWMPFTDPSKIKNVGDFGIAYHEGDNSIKSDDALGILSFRYTEPHTYWLPMPPDMPRTYENALALINKNAVSSDPEKRDMARATLNSGTWDENGKFNLEFRNEPWTNGAVFLLNPNPELPATTDKPTKASVSYTVAKAMAMYGDAARIKRGEQDGEYLDSLESWSDTQDYRLSHLQACPYPIPFDTNSRAPVLPQWYSTHTFTRYLSDDLHNRNKLLMANSTPIQFSIFAPLLDVMGIEVDWLDDKGNWQPDGDEVFNLRRTLSAQKPYLLLMNTNYEKFTSPMVEKYMQRSLFYGVFPSMFSADAATNPYWETPKWVERDRPLFVKYIPILKRISAAGWEPIPSIRSSVPQVYVERYGNRLFTAFNDDRQRSHDAALTIDLRSIHLPTISRITNLITGASVPFTVHGTDCTLTLRLDPETVAALELK